MTYNAYSIYTVSVINQHKITGKYKMPNYFRTDAAVLIIEPDAFMGACMKNFLTEFSPIFFDVFLVSTLAEASKKLSERRDISLVISEVFGHGEDYTIWSEFTKKLGCNNPGVNLVVWSSLPTTFIRTFTSPLYKRNIFHIHKKASMKVLFESISKIVKGGVPECSQDCHCHGPSITCLTRNEILLATALVAGMSTESISKKYSINSKVISYNKRNIMKKLGVYSLGSLYYMLCYNSKRGTSHLNKYTRDPSFYGPVSL